jgi:hypothetical protein
MKLKTRHHATHESCERNMELTSPVSAAQVLVVSFGKTRVPSKLGLPPPPIYHWSVPWRPGEMVLFPYLWLSYKMLDRSSWNSATIPTNPSFILMSYQPLGTYGMGQHLPYHSCHHQHGHQRKGIRTKGTTSTAAAMSRMFHLVWFLSGQGTFDSRMMGARRTIFCLNAPAMVNKDYHVMMLVSTPQKCPATSNEAMAHDHSVDMRITLFCQVSWCTSSSKLTSR